MSCYTVKGQIFLHEIYLLCVKHRSHKQKKANGSHMEIVRMCSNWDLSSSSLLVFVMSGAAMSHSFHGLYIITTYAGILGSSSPS